MKYYKIIFIGVLIFSIFLLPILVRIVSSEGKFFIFEKDIKVSTNTISIPFEFISFKDSVSKIKFYFKEKTNKNFIFPEYVLFLKKRQKYNNMFSIKIDEFKKYKNFSFYVCVEELFPYKKIKNVKIWNKKQIEQLIASISVKEKEILSETKQEISISTITTTLVKETKPSISAQKQEKVNIEKKEVKVITYREKPSFEVYISTESIKNKYTFGETVNLIYYIINKNKILSYTVNLNLYFKDIFNTIISTQNFCFSVVPNQINEQFISFEIPKDISSGEYFIELVTSVGKEKDIKNTERFFVSDLPPKITLIETSPVIRYKVTNTILVEVEDDRGVQTVDFIEFEHKTNQEKRYPMLLIAGDKKKGLYSYTTQKINYKGIYKFYIQAEDIDSNFVKTEIYEVEIIK